MTSIFFLMSVLFMWHEIYMMSGEKMQRDSWMMLTAAKENRDVARKKFVYEHWASLSLGLLYMAWSIVGFIASSQWIWFLLLICMGIVGSQLVKRLSFENFCTFKYADGIISIAILIWVSWNHFHQ